MFIGFIPFLVAAVGALLSLVDERKGRVVWGVAGVLLVAWTCFHGSHHAEQLARLGSW
ncbi:hypothetical protein [Sphingomonas sp.]|uniref:hypothetical protein n=1 Tax=Sphingomonas sp. TaxID=28214 RepID=UPI002FD91FB3